MAYFNNPVPEGDYDRRFLDQELRNISDAIIETTQPDDYVFITAPTVTDDITKRYQVFSRWLDTATNNIYMCANNTAGAAVWRQIG